MNGSTLLETWLSAGTTIDSLWSMYIVVHLGLFWFFFLVHRPLMIAERVLAVGAYLGFVLINGMALMNAYIFYEAIRRDLVARFSRELSSVPETLSVLNATSYGAHDKIILMTHVGGFIIVLALFSFRNAMIKRYFELYPDQIGKSLID